MALIGTLTSGVSALRTFSKGLEVIGNNIANVNTTGYKSSSASFADTFSNTLRTASASSSDTSIAVGTGVQLAGITSNFSQGSLSSTGNASDLGISGAGYFVVQDSSGVNYVTRDGSFHFDSSGNLVNAEGYSVLDSAGAKIQAVGKDASNNPVAYSSLASVSISSDGTLTAFASDGTSVASGQIGLLNIADQAKLMKKGNNLYDFSATGAVVGSLAAPNTSGLGSVQSGTLELSNVDLTEQFSDLITTQRSFQAGSRLITVSDSILEDIVNLKRS